MTQFKQFQEISINCWVYLNSISNYTIAESQGVLTIEIVDDSNGFKFEVTDANSNVLTVRSGQTPNTNEWYMLTLIYDQSELRGYVNSGSPNTTSANNNNLFNGDYGFEFGKFDGKGAEFRVYDYPITESEIQGMYDVIDTNGVLISSKKTK